jgi:hypothetical protein
VWWLKSHHNYSKRYLFFTPAGGINAVVLWWLKSHHTTERTEGVWLGGVVVFFQRYNTFKHKLHLTTPLKAIKTCFLLKKSTSYLSSKEDRTHNISGIAISLFLLLGIAT